MNNLGIINLINNVNKYSPGNEKIIYDAYNYAASKHFGQKRKSGEEYISHPLNVAYILSNLHADVNTICAGLLHDTLEDTTATKKEIINLFNEDIYTLVDGVTKIKQAYYTSLTDESYANTRKIITSLIYDPRIMIIKLADRLHNMRTLDYKAPEKRVRNAKETMYIFVTLAGYIGAYNIKRELEDLCFKNIDFQKYNEVLLEKNKVEEESSDYILEVKDNIQKVLNASGISCDLSLSSRNIYSTYQKLSKGYNIYAIHDLFAIKINTNNVEDCYKSLGLVHSIYHPINNRFKDYISTPKANMYQSIHSTIFGPSNHLIQIQIQTKQMDDINCFGITEYWNKSKNNAKETMLYDLKSKYQFFNKIDDLSKKYPNNQDFVVNINNELFSEIISVYDSNGKSYDIPKGFSVADYGVNTIKNNSDVIIGAYVNNCFVSPSYRLQNNDRIHLLYNKSKTLSLKR